MTEIDKRFGHNLDYLKPDPKIIEQIKHEDSYIYNLKKKQKDKLARRKIYENVQYTEFEKKGIQDLKDLFKQENENNKKLPPIELPSDWKESDWLKMCYTQRFDTKKCLEKLRLHVEWRNDPTNHNIDADMEKLISKGFVYQFGRDKGQRPVIVLDATKIDIHDGKENIVRALSIFLGAVKKYMFQPYAVENWVLILDLHGMGLGSVPMKALGAIIGSMSTNFCATLERMYIVNPSGGLSFMWGAVTAFMDDETSDKIKMIKSKEIAQVLDQIPNKKYLQQQHGGDQPNMEKDYWPPKDLFTDFEAIAKKKKEEEEKLKKQKEEEELKKQKEKDEQEKQEKLKKEQEEKEKQQQKENLVPDAIVQQKRDEQNNQTQEKEQISPQKNNGEQQVNFSTPQSKKEAQETQQNPGIRISPVEDKLLPLYQNEQEKQNSQNQNQDSNIVMIQPKQQKKMFRSAGPDEEEEEEVVQVVQKQQQQEQKSEVQVQENKDDKNNNNSEDQNNLELKENSKILNQEGVLYEGQEREGGCQCQCSIF